MRSRLRLKHLNTVHTGGKRFVYYRPKGQKGVRLPDLPFDDPRFLKAYAEAAGERPRAPVMAGSIAQGVIAYKSAPAFRLLAPTTRASRGRMLDDIAERYGAGRLADLHGRHIRKDLERLQGHAAVNRLKVWRGFCAYLVEEQVLPNDPSEGIRRARTAKSDGHIPWTAEDVTAFRARWPIGTVERLAFELIFWTGARVSDAIRMGEGNVDRDGWLTFRQQKTGGDVAIPLRADLPEFADGMVEDRDLLVAAIDARPDRHMVFLATRAGSGRSSKSVSQWFAGKARAAGLKDRTAHGLRKSRAIALVEADATHHQVAAWTGHESLKEVERYARKFDRRKVLTRAKREHESSKNLDRVPKIAEK